ncbi:MAG: ABC transporter permease [Bacteroidales bacterium]|nr:ABC transporter permease [Bacteroidales bacterium]
MKKHLYNIIIAVEALLTNRLKSILTALGIIFGVAAVIAMLAIGSGTQQEILDQLKMVGVNNILISSFLIEDENNDEQNQNKQKQKKFSRGLTLNDVKAIKEIIPNINMICPEITFETTLIREGNRKLSTLSGISVEYFDLFNIQIIEGVLFNRYQEENGIPVCIIDENIKVRLFNNTNPIGKYIKCGKEWLKVIGVVENKTRVIITGDNMPQKPSSFNIYIPVKTILMRYKNRALINDKLFNRPRYIIVEDGESQQKDKRDPNYHQLDQITLQVKETSELVPTSKIIDRLLLRRHSDVKDFEITIPELLLKQQQRTKDIFNIVLGAIASISLLVGGIGIMNIMFASVLERIKEIGVRMAIGARKQDIVAQFLAEAILICVLGGLIGILLGVILSKSIHYFANIQVIISPFSIIIAFLVSVSVGIIFGYSPAKKASEKDPIESLRYE